MCSARTAGSPRRAGTRRLLAHGGLYSFLWQVQTGLAAREPEAEE